MLAIPGAGAGESGLVDIGSTEHQKTAWGIAHGTVRATQRDAVRPSSRRFRKSNPNTPHFPLQRPDF